MVKLRLHQGFNWNDVMIRERERETMIGYRKMTSWVSIILFCDVTCISHLGVGYSMPKVNYMLDEINQITTFISPTNRLLLSFPEHIGFQSSLRSKHCSTCCILDTI